MEGKIISRWTIEDVLNRALSMEKQSYDLYIWAINRVTSLGIKKFLKELAQEELNHKEKISNVLKIFRNYKPKFLIADTRNLTSETYEFVTRPSKHSSLCKSNQIHKTSVINIKTIIFNSIFTVIFIKNIIILGI